MRVGRVLGLIGLAIGLAVSQGVAAADRAQDSRYISRITAKPLDPARMLPRDSAYRRDQEPDWVPRILEKMAAAKPSSFALKNYVLFRDDGAPTFMAFIWRDEAQALDRFELHEVEVKSPQTVLLHYLRDESDPEIDFVEPTGRDMFGDGVPSLFLAVGRAGGRQPTSRLQVYHLDRKSIRIALPEAFRPVRAEDLNNDSVMEIIASDDRFAGYHLGCDACGPHVPVVYKWDGDSFEAACTSFPDFYRARVTILRETLADERMLPRFLANRMDMMLSLAQIGAFEDARGSYRVGLAEFQRRSVTEWSKVDSEYLDQLWNQSRDHFLPILGAAEANADAVCPVAAVEAGVPDAEQQEATPQRDGQQDERTE